ncbi:hypothetical protein C8Q76DRAFT_33282 [Earliella scabrosa]|nr:hypothetical protein C8Q76DRAFT_33282 [Earliella scabrosa]
MEVALVGQYCAKLVHPRLFVTADLWSSLPPRPRQYERVGCCKLSIPSVRAGASPDKSGKRGRMSSNTCWRYSCVRRELDQMRMKAPSIAGVVIACVRWRQANRMGSRGESPRGHRNLVRPR